MQVNVLALHTETPALLSASMTTAEGMSTSEAIRLVSRQDEAMADLGWDTHPFRPGVFVKGEETATRRGVLIFQD